MGCKPPCKDCEKVGCGAYHDICEKYLEYKKSKKKEYDYRLENITTRQDIKSGIERMKRRGKR